MGRVLKWEAVETEQISMQNVSANRVNPIGAGCSNGFRT